MAERKERHSGRGDQKSASRPATPKLTHRTVEEFRGTALDVRELYRHRVFVQPVGSVWRDCALTWPWLRWFRLGSASLELELLNGRQLTVPLIWTECGIFNRYWLVCPLCQRTVRLLYGIDERCACQRCARGWPEIPQSAQNSAKARRDAIAAHEVSATSPIYAP